MLQKIASTRKTVVKQTRPKTKRTSPVSFSTAAIIERFWSRQERTSMLDALGTSPRCASANSA